MFEIFNLNIYCVRRKNWLPKLDGLRFNWQCVVYSYFKLIFFVSCFERNLFFLFKFWHKFCSLKDIRRKFVEIVFLNFNILNISLKIFWINLVQNLCIIIKSSFVVSIIFVCVWTCSCISQYWFWTIAMETMDYFI